MCASQCVHCTQRRASFTSVLCCALRANYIVNTPEKSMEHRYSSTYLFNTSCQMHNRTNRSCYSCSYPPSLPACLFASWQITFQCIWNANTKWENGASIWTDSSLPICVSYTVCIQNFRVGITTWLATFEYTIGRIRLYIHGTWRTSFALLHVKRYSFALRNCKSTNTSLNTQKRNRGMYTVLFWHATCSGSCFNLLVATQDNFQF